jgi:Leucine-rich repeat (LRR) protein
VPDTHSLHVFDHAWRAPFKFFESLRVLDLHCNRLKNADLVDICGLLWLRCLSLKGSLINLLPKEIGRLRRLWILNMSNTGILRLLPEIGELQELKILDISNTMVEELPEEIGKLKRLKTLYVRNSRVRLFPTQIRELQCLERLYARNTGIIYVPSEIRELQHLETLDVSDTNVAEVPIEIGALQHLKTLNISNTKITKLPIEIGDVGDLETLDISNTRITELPREIGKLQHLKSLNICNTEIRELPWEAGNRVNLVRVLTGESDAPKAVRLLEGVNQACYEDLGTTPILSIALFDRFGSSWEPLHFARFKVSSRHMSVPQCFKGYLRDISSLEISLWKIQEDDLKILQEMPNLQVLALRVEALHRNIIFFSRAGFQRLQSLCIDCRVPRVTFQRGALPELRYLNFKFYAFRPTERNASIEDPVGITHLQRLQRIVLRSASWYKSDTPGIKMIIDKVRKEARKHSNRITICINEMKEVFPANKVAADACQEESCSASAE